MGALDACRGDPVPPAALFAAARAVVLEEELPEAVAALEAAGGLRFDPLSLMPPLITDRTPPDGDERFQTITARRPVLEQVLGRAADAEPGLEVRRGVAVIRELVVRGYNGIQHVAGVRADSGEELRADPVVDAMGRRSQLPRWLEEAGADPVHEEVEDCGFLYYSRYFRSENGVLPEFRAPLITDLGTFSVLTVPSDNGTWSVTIYTSGRDQALKRLRDPKLWTALVAACPQHVQWIDAEPTSDVLPLGGLIDRYRRYAIGGRPVATGVAAVGDSCACTNPSNGRGMTLGLMQAQRLRDVIRAHLDDPREFAEAWDSATEAELTPWYRETVEEDRTRIREISALRNGLEPEPPGTASAVLRQALVAATARDPDAFRGFLASRCCLIPLRETFENPEFVEHILDLAKASERPPLAGPNRAQLLQLLDGSRIAV
jgi:flavin-dependent dehydrogenase